MDRQIIYPGQIPLETDLLNTNRFTLEAIGALASALFGSTTTVNNLTVAPTAPPSMSVQVGAGEIYSVENLDDTAYSSLPADTAHQIVKQGINANPELLSCPAPTTAGYSVNYLIQAAFSEIDIGGTVLPYYNSSDPTSAYSGPANTGASQPTERSGTAVITAKPGVAAPTGTQVTPTADAGYVGICVVSVAYGATTIAAGNISPISSASVVPAGGILAAIKAISYATRAETAAGSLTTKSVTPDGLAQAVQGGSFLYGVSTGSANALVVALNPAPASLQAGAEIIVKANAANTGAATLNLNGIGAKPITFNGAPLSAGLLTSGQLYALIYDGSSFQLQSPTMSGIIAYQLGVNGYEIYSHGRIEQWGTVAIPSGSNTEIFSLAFSIAFPNAVWSVVGNANNGANTLWGTIVIGFPNPTLTGTGVVADSANSSQSIASGRSLYWRALGN